MKFSIIILSYHETANNKNSSYHLLSTYYVPSTMLSAFHVLANKILIRSHGARSINSILHMRQLSYGQAD